jgi:hypothetical protein
LLSGKRINKFIQQISAFGQERQLGDVTAQQSLDHDSYFSAAALEQDTERVLPARSGQSRHARITSASLARAATDRAPRHGEGIPAIAKKERIIRKPSVSFYIT